MKRIAISLLTILLIGLTYPASIRFSHSFKFVDEDEHMVIGMLLTKGYTLYRDISTNHQPLNYLVSAAVHQIFQPDNLYMLVQRHRQTIFLFSLVSAGLLSFRFGLVAVFPLMVFEASKYWLLGNVFLAESMATYLTAYFFGSTWELFFKEQTKKEDLFLGITYASACLLSITLLIPLSVLAIIRFMKLKNLKSVLTFVVGIMLIVLPVFIKVPIVDYIGEAIISNAKYGVPMLSEFDQPMDAFLLFLIPIRSILAPFDSLSLVYLSLGIVWVFGLGYYLSLKKYKNASFALGFYLIWGLTNTRDIELHRYYYAGFHLLPWFLTGLMLVSMLTTQVLDVSSKKMKLVIWGGLLVWFGWFFSQPGLPWRNLPDPQTEHYVQYTPQQQISEVINSLKQPGDRLMSVPNETLPHFTTQLTPATRQVTYYEWQYRNPKLSHDWFDALSNKPPEFIIYYEDSASFTAKLKEVITQKYVKLLDYPLVYFRKDALDHVNTKQRQDFLDLSTQMNGINMDVFNTK